MDIPRNPSNLPPIPERTSTPHVQHDTAPRGNNFHPDGRHGGTRDLDHGHAVRLFHGHDESYQGDRDPRLYARYEGVPAGRAGVVIGGCQVGVGVPPRSGTPSHNIALCRASAGSQSGSQWLTMARCAGLVGVERSCSRCIVSTRDSMLCQNRLPDRGERKPTSTDRLWSPISPLLECPYLQAREKALSGVCGGALGGAACSLS